MNSIEPLPGNTRGFTLIEIVLVFALTLTLSFLVVPLSFRGYTLAQHSHATNLILETLRTAQAQARYGTHTATHGVYFSPEGATLFTGNSYENRNDALDRFILLPPFSLSGPHEVTFTSPQGIPGGPTTLTFSLHGHTATITISDTGLITRLP